MISVSTAFKNAMKSASRKIASKITYGATTIDTNELISLVIKNEGDIMSTVMRGIQIMYKGSHDLLGETVNAHIGVEVSGSPVFIDYGSFIITEVSFNKDTNTSTAKGFDLMYKSLARYNLELFTYPTTAGDLLTQIADVLGLTVDTGTFLNDDVAIEVDPFVFRDITYRGLLEQIAELAGAYIYLNTDNEIVVNTFNTSVQDEITADHLISLKIEREFGAFNSVRAVYASEREFYWNGGYAYPNLLTEDGEELLTEDEENLTIEYLEEQPGLYQMEMENNLLIKDEAQDVVDSLYTIFNGEILYPFSARTVGLGYFEVGDWIELTDQNSNTYETVILRIELSVSETGFQEMLYCSVPNKSNTNEVVSSGVITTTIEGEKLQGSHLIDNSVTSAKIHSLTADKIETGTLGVNQTIILRKDGVVRGLIGSFEIDE